MNYYNLVKEFAITFGQPVAAKRTRLTEERHQLRMRLIREEWIETLKASRKGDREDMLDGLVDLMYVVTGYRVEAGYGSVEKEVMDHDGLFYTIAEHIGQIDVHYYHIESDTSAERFIKERLEMIQDYVLTAACRMVDQQVFEKAFLEVHAANMAKLWTMDEMSIYELTHRGDENAYTFKEVEYKGAKMFVATRPDGKIMKPPSWTPPNIKQFI